MKLPWTLALAFILLNVITHVEGQRVIASLGSKLKQFGARSQKATKGKYGVEEGENHDTLQELWSYLRPNKRWNTIAVIVTSIVMSSLFWYFLPTSSEQEDGEFLGLTE